MGALPLGFQVKLVLVRGKWLLAGFLGAGASNVFSSSTGAFRVLLSVLCGPPRCLLLLLPVGVDPAFNIVWSRFRMIRRYFVYCPEEEPRIFRMLDLMSWGVQGHDPVHLLFISAVELVFVWDGAEKGWVRVSLLPQLFYSFIWDAWRFSVYVKLPERTCFFRW